MCSADVANSCAVCCPHDNTCDAHLCKRPVVVQAGQRCDVLCWDGGSVLLQHQRIGVGRVGHHQDLQQQPQQQVHPPELWPGSVHPMCMNRGCDDVINTLLVCGVHALVRQPLLHP